MFPFEATGLAAVILCCSLPIIFVIGVVWVIVARAMYNARVKKAILSSTTDPEIAKILLAESSKKTNKYTILNWACALLGLGLGALVSWLIGSDEDEIYFWILLAAGMGLGFLISFIVSWKLSKQQPQQEDESETQAQEIVDDEE